MQTFYGVMQKNPKLCELMSASELIFADILEIAQFNKIVDFLRTCNIVFAVGKSVGQYRQM